MECIDKDTLVELRQKIQDALLKSVIDYYEAERACCELVVPQSWKDDRKKAWEEFVWRYQDYELVFKDDMDITNDDLNYDDYETD